MIDCISKRLSIRSALWVGAAAISMLGAGAGTAQAASTQSAGAAQLSIPSQPLSTTLNEIGRQTNAEVIFMASAVRGKRAPALNGTYSAEQALALAIDGAPLRVRRTPQGAYLVQATADAAQSAPGEAGAGSAAAKDESADTNDGLEEIVVTAQRREESAQDTPIAVAAFNADQLTKAGVLASEDLPSVVPGLSLRANGARANIYLRGVGNLTANSPSAVLTFIDGIYQPFDTKLDFSNIQSIEIIKGPQGTLFGRNATGGVLQITTKNPFDWQGADAQVGYANYDTYSAKLYASAKLSDMVAADLSGFYYNQTDGWGHNIDTGADMFTEKRYGVRSKWVAKLDDSFTATLTGDYSYAWSQTGSSISQVKGIDFLYNPVTDQKYTLPSIYDVVGDKKGFGLSKEGGAALTLDKHFGDIRLLSISSYRRKHEELVFDGDLFDVVTRWQPRTTFTQEFQLSGVGTHFNWVTGLYYYSLNEKVDPLSLAGPGSVNFGLPPGAPFSIFSRARTKAYAAYAQATVEFLPDTNLTLGARYTIEKQRVVGFTAVTPIPAIGPITVPGSAGKQSATFKKPNFRVALDHKFTPNVLAYASWNRGFNAGFHNSTAFAFNEIANPLVKPEVIDAYEVGMKSDLLDRRLRVNVAAFLYDFKNKQERIFEVTGDRTLNAASARIKGIDLDITARPVRDLTLSFAANYLDTEYTSYPKAPNDIFLPNGALIDAGAKDAKGKRLVQSPKFGLQASATYNLHTSIGTFGTTANVNYQGKVYVDPQNHFPLPKRTLIGLTEQWTSNDENTYVTAWVKNLTDEKYNAASGVLSPQGLLGVPGAPRTYGISIGRKF